MARAYLDSYTAALLPGARALVVTVWKPVSEEGLSPANQASRRRSG
jgi:hypothetical protein